MSRSPLYPAFTGPMSPGIPPFAIHRGLISPLFIIR